MDLSSSFLEREKTTETNEFLERERLKSRHRGQGAKWVRESFMLERICREDY